jgi:predicted transcriptional regulator of viral defense system
MTPETFLSTHRLFTRDEFASQMAPRTARATIDSTLHRWLSQGRIERVKRGLFVRADSLGRSLDLLALAARMAPDAALSHHTALEAHGFAQSLFERLTYATWTRTRAREYAGRTFAPVQPRARIREHDGGARWIAVIDRRDLPVRTTTVERTVIDALDRLDLSGGLDEVWRSLGAVGAIDPTEFEAYLTAVGVRALNAKAGFFLDTHKERLAVPDSVLDRIAQEAPRSPVYFDRARGGQLVKRWSLIVPEDLLQDDYEEVL